MSLFQYKVLSPGILRTRGSSVILPFPCCVVHIAELCWRLIENRNGFAVESDTRRELCKIDVN